MTPEQWRKISPILESALQLSPDDRPAFLDGACPDAELRREVESLIASPGLRSSFLESPAVAQVVPIESTASVSVWTAGMKLGPYEIQSLLGAGGMGEVYRARDKRLDRIVAIKVLPRHLSSDPARRQRLEREARAVAALQHANICTLFDVGNQDGTDYLVMEYLEGETLSARLSKGPLPLDNTLRYGIEVADALETAHRHGIVHRDLKPGNIMVTAHGECKVLDFGLAMLSEDQPSSEATTIARHEALTSPGQALGTVAYMSPEQARGEPLDSRTDIFSLGAVLFEMATGKMAFAGKTSAVIFKAILDSEPPPPSEINKAVPERLDEVIGKCIEKDRELRYQSAAEVRTDLKRLKRDSESARHLLSGSAKVTSERRSSRRWWGVAALFAIAIVVTFAWWWKMAIAAPQLEGVVQITNDGEVKQVDGPLVSDGSRLYFNESRAGSWEIAQVSISGGQTAIVNSWLANAIIKDIAPDGSSLLVTTGEAPANPLWILPLPVGEPRRVGDLLVEDAAWFPDSQRILFNREKSLYVALSDGSDSHKLVDLPGESYRPRISPDGQRIRITAYGGVDWGLWEVRSDGTNLHQILTGWNPSKYSCCATWTADGANFLFQNFQFDSGYALDIYASQDRHGFLGKTVSQPVRLTAGPLSYTSALPVKDARRIFVFGSKPRGEMVRYDAASRQFVPYFSGISAYETAFSKDEKWVAYISYPDRELWRMRVDGSDKRQLTFLPWGAILPQWSPDGKRIAFGGWGGASNGQGVYVVNADGGTPQKVAGDANCAFWSSDGNTLGFGDAAGVGIRIIDLRTGKVTPVPGAEDKFDPRLSPDGKTILSSTTSHDKLMLFDLKQQKWSQLLSGNFLNHMWSRDGRDVYYVSSNPDDPKMERIRLADRKIETVASLKEIRRVFIDRYARNWADLAPDGSLLLMRDIGTQEIYALNVRWP